MMRRVVNARKALGKAPRYSINAAALIGNTQHILVLRDSNKPIAYRASRAHFSTDESSLEGKSVVKDAEFHEVADRTLNGLMDLLTALDDEIEDADVNYSVRT